MSFSTTSLIPGLPDDIATRILLSLPLSLHPTLLLLSRPIHALLTTPSLLSLRRNLHLRHHHLVLFPSDPSHSPPFLLDPSTLLSLPLPPLPVSTHLHSLSNFRSLSVPPFLFLLGGSHFDANSYPLHRPLPSSLSYSLDLSVSGSHKRWVTLRPMNFPRGSFACAAIDSEVIVAGGGSRHVMFPNDGSRSRVVEVLDLGTGVWREVGPMPRCRAGCVGWVMDGEFWVVGGYGGYRTVSGVFPVDVHCRDAVAMGLESGVWREVGDMWGDGERRRLGKVAVVEREDGTAEAVYMLDAGQIFRYDVATNRWLKETTLRQKIVGDDSCGFVAMDGELYILTSPPTNPIMDPRRQSKKKATLDIQVYDPKKRKWRFLTATTPFTQPIDFKIAVYCTMYI